MNLIIDIGNSRTKYAIFEHSEEIHFESSTIPEIPKIRKLKIDFQSISQTIISATGNVSEDFIRYCQSIFPKVLVFSYKTQLPFRFEYKTPATIGLDRLAGIAGAQKLFPDKNVLIIDVGTAITFDVKNSNNIFRGGNISPGMMMRFKALNKFTDKLPLVTPNEKTSFLGDSTNQAIANGVINGIIYEIEGMIAETEKKYNDLTVILTGGDTSFFDNKLKKTIFVFQNLINIGLDIILNYNAGI